MRRPWSGCSLLCQRSWRSSQRWLRAGPPCFYQRNYVEAIRILAESPHEVLKAEYYLPKAFMLAQIYHARERAGESRRSLRERAGVA